jgi:hypothetical protein
MTIIRKHVIRVRIAAQKLNLGGIFVLLVKCGMNRNRKRNEKNVMEDRKMTTRLFNA